MKKTSIIFILTALLVGCQSAPVTNDSHNEPKSIEQSADIGKVEVDKGIINVEIKLPSSFFEGQDIDQTISKAKEDGIKEGIKNTDGSVTYIMSKQVHTDIMKKAAESIDKAISDIKNKGQYKSIKEIEHNKGFTELTVTVDRSVFENSFDGLALLGLSISSMYYQIFDGVPADKTKVAVHYKDTAGVFKTVVYPDDLNVKK